MAARPAGRMPALRIALAACAVLTLSSCTKEIGYFRTHSPAACCRIDSVGVGNYMDGPLVQRWHFSYNKAGQPTSIEAVVPTAYNYSGFVFRYDNRGRLKDYLQTDGGGATYVYVWERYTYPAPHTIVDSSYDYQGTTSDPNPIYPNEFHYKRTITQDDQGRTIRVIFSLADYQDTTYTYYDAQGDVIRTDVGYDDKVNWYQLSPTWQLVYNDYSRHNPYIPADVHGLSSISSYDQFGLPTAFWGAFLPSAEFGAFEPGQFGQLFMADFYLTLDVSYSCDHGNDPELLSGVK